MSTKLEMDIEVEVKEATKAMDEEYEATSTEDKIEDNITASTVGRMTTSV
jgi:hypothetical protein